MQMTKKKKKHDNNKIHMFKVISLEHTKVSLELTIFNEVGNFFLFMVGLSGFKKDLK